MYEVRVYQGDSVRTMPLDAAEGMSFGEDKKCSCAFPKGSCPGVSVRLLCENGAWKAECAGPVLHNGKPAQTAMVQNGDMLILNQDSHLAVQLVFRGEKPAAEIHVDGLEELLIGRADNCALQLKHRRVSASHAKLYRSSGQWRLCDINSTNGTFVEGRRISECALKEGEAIVIGPYDMTLSGGILYVYGKDAASHVQAPVREEPVRESWPEFVRSPRLTRELAEGELEIEAAPSIGEKPEINWLSVLLPSLGGVGLMLVLVLLTGMSPVSLLFSAPMAVIGVIMTVVNYRRQTKVFSGREELRAEKYEQYLAGCEERLRSFAAEQREIAVSANPAPEGCLRLVSGLDARLWVRTPGDADFLSLRIGLGEEPLKMSVKTPKLGVMLEEDAFTRRPAALAEKYRTVPDVPVTVDLLRYSNVGVVGNRSRALNTVRCMTVQLAAHHSYDEVKLAVIFPKEEYEQWSWMRWLPHTWNDGRTARFLACTSFDASQLLDQLTAECRERKKDAGDLFAPKKPALPHYVLIIAAPELVRNAAVSAFLTDTPGVSSIWLSPSVASLPQGIRQIVDFGAQPQLYLSEQASDRRTFRADEMGTGACERFARSMAPVRLRGGRKQGLPDRITFLEGYHASRVEELDIGDFWQNARCEETLSVPIGMRENGETYYFDIHEKKDGPHGLVAGTSGSGKSEMAQSWIASMALQFSPEDVNFILVDFKGTSLLQPFKGLPHLAGSISNLDQDVGRCLLALESEMERRQRIFDQNGVSDIRGYLKKRRKNADMERMPFLILVIDEFAEFKAQFPDFTGPLNHVFRGGRSLGVYTMIMTQKPSGVVTEQMTANANFRWGLRVQSESDSRDMLGISDAVYLTVPGRSYVRAGDGSLELIQPFFSGASYRPDAGKKEAPPVCTVSLSGERKAVAAEPVKKAGEAKEKQIDAVVRAITEYCRRKEIPCAGQLWTEPLPDRLELAQLLPSERLWEGPAQWNRRMEGAEGIFGRIDDPVHQIQRPLVHDFWKNGNLLVYGMPLSGKTTLLTSLLVSLCCRYSPAQLQLYLLEFGGFGLRSMETFPHVGGAAGEDEPETLERICAHLTDELGRRKKLFRKYGVGTMAAYEDAAGELLPTLILMADNLNLAGARFPQLQERLVQLTREGEAFGIYMAAAVTGSSGPGYQLAQNFKTVMTLQLTDRLDYTQLVGRVSGNIPKAVIGRGLISGPLEFHTAIAGKDLTDGQRIAMLRRLAEEMACVWDGPLPFRVMSMPDQLPYGSVKGEPLVLGLSYGETAPVTLPARGHTSLLISCGDVEAKERILALLYREAAELPDASVYLYGWKTGADRELPERVKAAEDAEELGGILKEIAPVLKERQGRKTSDENAEFPHIFIFVDELAELLETAQPRVISQMEAFIRLGQGIGVTVIGADLAAKVERCYYSGDILLETMHEGPVILAGGQAEDHRIVDTLALKRILPAQGLGEDLALLEDGSYTRVRPMEAGTGAR